MAPLFPDNWSETHAHPQPTEHFHETEPTEHFHETEPTEHFHETHSKDIHFQCEYNICYYNVCVFCPNSVCKVFYNKGICFQRLGAKCEII